MASARERLLQANKARLEKSESSKDQSNLVDVITEQVEHEGTKPVDPEPVKTIAEHPQMENINLPNKEDYYVDRFKMYNANTEYNKRKVNVTLTKPIKKTRKSKQLSIRVYDEIYDCVMNLASDNGLSTNETMNQILAQFFELDIFDH